jgi:hypothetical protein
VLTILGIVVSAACVFASARRLRLAALATPLDPALLASALRAEKGRDPSELCSALRQELVAEADADWERDLFSAVEATGPARTALVNEQLAEIDYRTQSWGRVPRVCASISTSFGFLLAFAMVASMAASAEVDVSAIAASAINVVAVGLAGAAFCVAAQLRANALVRERLAATDGLVNCLESLTLPSAS